MPQRPEITTLSPTEEQAYRTWLAANRTAPGIANADSPAAHYDMRGFFADKQALAQWKPGEHFPDTYKQHGHPTFSVESKYSAGPNDGGSWNGDTFVPQTPAPVKRDYAKEADEIRQAAPAPRQDTGRDYAAEAAEIRNAAPQPAAPPGPVSRFLSDATAGLNPLNIIKGLSSQAARPIFGGSIPIVSRIPFVGSEAERIAKVWQQDSGSGPADATLRTIESVPVVGPSLIKIGQRVNEGNYAGALGTSANLAATAAAPEVIGGALTLAGKAATGVGRFGVGMQLRPMITNEARAMTGQAGEAADRAILDTAARERTLPGFLNPRDNQAGSRIAASEARVAEMAKGPAGQIPVPNRDVIWSGPVDRMNLANRDLLPGDRNLAVSHAQPALEAVANDIPRTVAERTAQVAGSRPLNLRTGAAGTPARAIQQGTREANINALLKEGSPESIALANELQHQMALAPVEQTLANERPMINSEGVPLGARIKVGIINRAMSPANRTALVSGNALTASGQALASIPRDTLLRMALMQQMQPQVSHR